VEVRYCAGFDVRYSSASIVANIKSKARIKVLFARVRLVLTSVR
jgi:hypothetical protein